MFLHSPCVLLALMSFCCELKKKKLLLHPTTLPGYVTVPVLGNANPYRNRRSGGFPCGFLSSSLMSWPGMTVLPASHWKRGWCFSLYPSTKISCTASSISCLLQRITPDLLRLRCPTRMGHQAHFYHWYENSQSELPSWETYIFTEGMYRTLLGASCSLMKLWIILQAAWAIKESENFHRNLSSGFGGCSVSVVWKPSALLNLSVSNGG